jgi:hypothetical protein
MTGADRDVSGEPAPGGTGRQLAHRALRGPMRAIGWTPRAAGWFSTAVAAGCTGVVAVGVASEHALPGSAEVTCYVHFRREDVEPVVRDLAEVRGSDGGYRSATATTSLGYLLPERAWRTWPVTLRDVDAVAAEIAGAVRDHAVPYLEQLAVDPDRLVAAATSSPSVVAGTADGVCRVTVLLVRLGRPEQGRAFLARRLAALGARVDPAAERMRRMADRLFVWLDGLP